MFGTLIPSTPDRPNGGPGAFSSRAMAGMAGTMLRTLIIVVAALVAGSVPACAQSADSAPVRCAAAFAIIADAQARGIVTTPALPPLAQRGKRYMGLIGERLARESGLTGDAVRDALADAARKVAHDGAAGVAATCLPDLDRLVPPRPALGAVTCAALLDVYADVLAARDPADPRIAGLRRDSASFGAAPDPHEKARISAALADAGGAIDADDYTQCRAMAAAPR